MDEMTQQVTSSPKSLEISKKAFKGGSGNGKVLLKGVSKHFENVQNEEKEISDPGSNLRNL